MRAVEPFRVVLPFLRSLAVHASVLAALFAPALARTQDAPLAGPGLEGVAVRIAVTDRTTQVPIPAVRVILRTTAGDTEFTWQGATDETGALVTPRLLPGEYRAEFRALGFAEFLQPIRLDGEGRLDVAVGLVPEAIELPGVLVSVHRDARLEREGFYQRQDRGSGYFLTRADIDLRNPTRTSDLLMGIPGARVSSARLGQPGGAITLRDGCVPTVVLNGGPISMPISLDELVNLHDVEAVEIYHGSAGPVQFTQFASCGTIVVWTRERSAVQYPQPVTWRRILGVGFFLGFVFLATR